MGTLDESRIRHAHRLSAFAERSDTKRPFLFQTARAWLRDTTGFPVVSFLLAGPLGRQIRLASTLLKVKITKLQCTRRTASMLADFLNEPYSAFRTTQKLKKDWDMTDDDLEVLERWIEGPISKSKAIQGFFQDVGAQVTPADLKDDEKAGTVGLLSELIWQGIPHANRA